MRHRHEHRNKRKDQRAPAIRRVIPIAAILLLLILVLAVGCQGVVYVTQSPVDEEDLPEGIDVSSYQEEIDWKGVRGEGYRFAFIKATEGSTHVDPAFRDNWKKSRRAGLKTGAYHFLSFDTEGETQAENFIDTVPRTITGTLPVLRSYSARRPLPPAVDVEMYGEYETAPPTQEELDGILQPLLEELEEHYGCTPILYANPYVYEKYLAAGYSGYPVWISDPEAADELPDGREWTFCQYTFEGSSPSVDGGAKDLDIDIYRGSVWELRHMK